MIFWSTLLSIKREVKRILTTTGCLLLTRMTKEKRPWQYWKTLLSSSSVQRCIERAIAEELGQVWASELFGSQGGYLSSQLQRKGLPFISRNRPQKLAEANVSPTPIPTPFNAVVYVRVS
jgi:hypothetical protein